tara:strand:- start:6628 stop:7953 length:1326 start_codon:yes stop_codon:yes gene_type:complete
MPETTISLNFTQDGSAANAYDITLENEDVSFGIIDLTTGTVVVEAGAATDDPSADPSATIDIANPEVGLYQFTFDSTVGHTYLVAWKITANAGEPPVYKVEQVGPFYSIVDSSISSVSNYKGIFRQGTLATLLLRVTDFNGNPTNAEEITIKIYDENGSQVDLDETVPERPDDGFYVYDWSISITQTPGKYTVLWVYKIDGVEDTEIQEVTVSEDADDSIYYSSRLNDFRIALEHHICCAQGIPVYYEQAKASRNRSRFEFSFPRWNQTAGVRVYRNKELINTGLLIDYFKGTVTFDSTLIPEDIVHADYNFRWFSDADLDRFLHNAVQTVNIYPPASPYTIENVPDRFIPIVLYGATKDALRKLVFCLQFQEPQQIFGGREAASKASSEFMALKENYEKDWEKLLEQKKYGPYPSSHTLVTPEFTLPGGRSRWFRYLFKG